MCDAFFNITCPSSQHQLGIIQFISILASPKVSPDAICVRAQSREMVPFFMIIGIIGFWCHSLPCLTWLVSQEFHDNLLSFTDLIEQLRNQTILQEQLQVFKNYKNGQQDKVVHGWVSEGFWPQAFCPHGVRLFHNPGVCMCTGVLIILTPSLALLMSCWPLLRLSVLGPHIIMPKVTHRGRDEICYLNIWHMKKHECAGCRC